MRPFLIVIAALNLAACATVPKLDAAADVHALLIAIRDNDRQAFDAHVDRGALKREIQARLVAEAGRADPRVAAVAALLGPGVASIAGDALIRPEVFRAVANYYGYRSDTKIPGPLAISTTLRRLPDGRVCAVKDKAGPCLLTFTRAEDGRWRLSGFDGELSMLRL